MKKVNTNQFVKRANKIHNYKYDYSETEYLNSKTKIIIICPIHGKFSQNPNNHLSLKRGCCLCGGSKKSTTKEFIQKAKKIHNNKYDYSRAKYFKAIKNVIIICKQHGEFLQTPNNHLRGQGCPKCYYVRTTKEFIAKANKIHNNRYNYSKTCFINSKEKITIICANHGEFLQSPNNHLNGQQCPNCFGTLKLTTQQFIKKANNIHNNKYDYSRINYINTKTKIIIICKQHGEFKQIPNGHLQGKGCLKCSCNVSKNEIIWLNLIEARLKRKLRKNQRLNISKQFIKPDGFDPVTNTIYEYYGYYFHGHPDKYKQNDINKVNNKTFGKLYRATLEREKIIKEAGYNLITKWGN